MALREVVEAIASQIDLVAIASERTQNRDGYGGLKPKSERRVA